MPVVATHQLIWKRCAYSVVEVRWTKHSTTATVATVQTCIRLYNHKVRAIGRAAMISCADVSISSAYVSSSLVIATDLSDVTEGATDHASQKPRDQLPHAHMRTLFF